MISIDLWQAVLIAMVGIAGGFFNVVAGNNKVVATSQPYKTENSLNKGIDSVRKNATKKNLS